MEKIPRNAPVTATARSFLELSAQSRSQREATTFLFARTLSLALFLSPAMGACTLFVGGASLAHSLPR